MDMQAFSQLSLHFCKVPFSMENYYSFHINIPRSIATLAYRQNLAWSQGGNISTILYVKLFCSVNFGLYYLICVFRLCIYYKLKERITPRLTAQNSHCAKEFYILLSVPEILYGDFTLRVAVFVIGGSALV